MGMRSQPASPRTPLEGHPRYEMIQNLNEGSYGFVQVRFPFRKVAREAACRLLIASSQNTYIIMFLLAIALTISAVHCKYRLAMTRMFYMQLAKDRATGEFVAIKFMKVSFTSLS